jgi:hypothetical protein
VERADSVPDLVLTEVARTGPTSLRVSWSGGDGTNTVQTSLNGQGWTDAAIDAGSPTVITVNPGANPTLLVRVIEP